MFLGAGYNATSWESIGNLKLHTNGMYRLFMDTPHANATISLYNNVTLYNNVFTGAATEPGSGIKVNYSVNTAYIDDIIATKSAGSNVVKGDLID